MTRPIRARETIFCLLLCLAIGGAAAQYPCVKAKPWTCFGSIEMSIASDTQTATVQMQVFDNGDMLAELGDKVTPNRKLLVLGPPPIRALYKGVADKEIQEGHPFIFFDYAFAAPIQALDSAYPNGPSSVPEKESETRVLLDGPVEATLLANKVSNNRIHFKIAMLNVVLNGFVDYARKAGVPDTFQLDHWKDRSLRTYATVGDARAAQLGR
jgi:hypothetical protein